MSAEPTILFEDNHLLVLTKPVNWIVQGAGEGDASLLEWGKGYLKEKYQKPGNVYLGCVSRLDRFVSGVVPLARTSKAAARMNEQIRERKVSKEYLAIVSPPPAVAGRRLEHFLVRDEPARLSVAFSTPKPHSQVALMEYQTLSQNSAEAALLVQLHTGRKHQIRAQLAAIGSPILGDQKYGSQTKFGGGIALHCWRFTMQHPTTRESLVFQSQPGPQWNSRGLCFDME